MDIDRAQLSHLQLEDTLLHRYRDETRTQTMIFEVRDLLSRSITRLKPVLGVLFVAVTSRFARHLS